MDIKDFNEAEVERRLHYTFQNKQLLKRAFVHSSYANAQSIPDNERFEYLGDAILEAVVSEYLFKKYPKSSAGALSTMRAKVVSADGLRPIVDKLGLVNYLMVMGTSPKIQNLSRKIESNLYEAALCAIYLDGGMASAQEFVLRTLKKSMDNVNKTDVKDYKTRVQEYCQQRKWSVKYQLEIRTGPDNMPSFTYLLFIDGKPVSKGNGSSIKTAQQDAAQKLVEKWRIE